MTNAGAEAVAADVASLEAAEAAGLLAGLEQVKAEIVNYAQPAAPEPTPTPASASVPASDDDDSVFGIGATGFLHCSQCSV
ncbi:MAG: hypothetical protein KAJ92_02790 [Gammaproteobacteria bacterium]|nr:hypothetical protein [Gammaproteobacteria bacterium]